MAPMWSRDSAMERRRPLMTSSDRGSDSDHGSASPLARGGQLNGNHRRHLSSGGSSDDSVTTATSPGTPAGCRCRSRQPQRRHHRRRDDPRRLREAHHEAMATILACTSAGRAWTPMPRRFQEVPEPAKSCPRSCAWAWCSCCAPRSSSRAGRSRRDGSTQLWKTRRSTKIEGIRGGARTATRCRSSWRAP